MENDIDSDYSYITSFTEENGFIVLGSNIRVNTLPKTESDQHFERTLR